MQRLFTDKPWKLSTQDGEYEQRCRDHLHYRIQDESRWVCNNNDSNIEQHAAYFQSLSLSFSSRPSATTFKPLSSSANASFNAFSTGLVYVNPILGRQAGRSITIVCEGGAGQKADSAAKRARQAEKRRLYNKSRKSEIRTRMKKVLEELDLLRKKTDAQQEEVIGVEKLIAEAYSVIDKVVQVGTLHRNTGARRKSRLARRKKAVEIHHGWYAPEPSPASTV